MQLIQSIAIEGFRGLANLQVKGLGRVNLVTGSNNSGKSSFLEVIRLLVTAGAVQTFRDILNYREELVGVDPESPFGRGDVDSFSTLFSGCPDLSSKPAGFTIRAQGELPPSLTYMTATTGWYVRRFDAERTGMSYEPADLDLFETEEVFPGLDLKAAGRSRILPLDRIRRVNIRLDAESSPIACVYLDPFSSRSTNQLGPMWDAIALTDSEKETVRALRVISPEIEGVSMIGSDERGRRRTAIVKSTKFSSPVPLRTFGDGVNRLFGIVLSICNARNGVLLIDEIENGLHYSVQLEVWKTIFRLSRTLNVQVFATSHSYDCVRSFAAAAIESEQDGVLLRLTKRDGEVIPTTFTEEELAIVSREQVEVR